MNLLQTQPMETEEPASLPAGTLLLAVLAPFTSVIILAAPLLIDAARHAVSL